MTELAKRVCLEYIKNTNLTEVGLKAGVKGRNIKATVWQIIQRPSSKEFIAALKDKIAKKTMITAERTLKELGNITHASIKNYYNEEGRFKKIHELTDEEAAAVESVEMGADGRPEKIKLFSKEQCLEKQMKYFGLYKVDNSQQANIVITTKEHKRTVRNFSEKPYTPEEPGENV